MLVGVRRLWVLAASATLLFLGVCFYLKTSGERFYQKVYRIGWQSDPPFQDRAADGTPSGLAVELVQDAARRRGIRLQWMWYPRGPDAGLRSHDLDLWPLVTILPERKRVFHFSKPYLDHENVLLVLADSQHHGLEDLASSTISYYELAVNQRLLHTLLPQARLISTPNQKDNVEAVCTDRSEAAFLDEFTASSVLLSGLACASQPLRVLAIPSLQTSLSIGATFENAAVADEIRRGMDIVAAEGGIDKILSDWGLLSMRNLTYFSGLRAARRREPWLLTALVIFVALLVLSFSAWYRIRAQKDRIASAEAAARESGQKLRLLANSLNEVVLAFDMQRNLVFTNPALERLTGYAAEELQLQNALFWVHPDDADRVNSNWSRLFDGGSYRDLEYRLITRDGQVKWVTANWGPMVGEDGRQIGVYGTERDITERKLAEQALRESERQFRELLEGVQLIAVVIDSDGIIRFCNDYTLAVTGWSATQMVGRPGAEILDEEFLRRLHQGGTGVALPFLEGTVRTSGGERRRIQWSSGRLWDADGRPAGFACLGADITELESLRAEAARRESDERFRAIADTAPLMIWIAGPDRQFTFVNKGWLDFTGQTADQELGEGWLASIHPADVKSCLNSYEEAFASRQDFHVQYRKRRADGEYRWVLASAVPRFGADGEFDGYVGSCADITELRRAQAESIARQKLETVVLLASGIAHDFNNLLGAVLGQADVALADLAEGFSPAEPLRSIRGIAVRGAGIVRQLMIFAGQEKTVSEALDLSSVIEESMDLLKAVVSKHAVLKTDLAAQLPAINANPAQIRQVLMNLVINASEAIGERDGVITLRTARVADRPDRTAGPAGEFVKLEVSDTGPGMALDEQSKAFDPYFTTKSPGKGLGLPVVQGIVRGLGGSIQLDSEPRKGSTFRLFFASTDLKAPAILPAAPSQTVERPERQGFILVVEDEVSLRLASATILRRQGYSVLEAADGNTAINLIHQHKDAIGLLLLDLTLPGAPSREVYAEGRRARPDLKIIVTSAYGQSAVDAALLGCEVDAFLRKPYELARLIELTRRFMSASPDPQSHGENRPSGSEELVPSNPNS